MGSIGPGPAYSLPTTIGYERHDQRKTRSPQYTMAGRLKDSKANIMPGPDLNIQGLTRHGRPTSYAYSMASRTLVKDSTKVGPGPANYNLSTRQQAATTSAPSYSFGRRDQYRFKNQCPGPNAYGVKDGMIRKTAPSYSIGTKTVSKNKGGSPGPANYPASNLKTIFNKSPEYTISPRIKIIDRKYVPGANAYDRINYKPGKSSPSYSFGLCHSLRAPPMVVHCDNV